MAFDQYLLLKISAVEISEIFAFELNADPVEWPVKIVSILDNLSTSVIHLETVRVDTALWG